MSDSTTHKFEVTVTGCSAENAAAVIASRIDHDEDLGFDYKVSWGGYEGGSEEEIPEDAHLHDDPATDTRIANAEGWGLFDIDSTGILEIQRCDEANVFASDAEALVFVRGRANRGSPYHQKAIRIHRKHAEQASYYRDGHMIEKSKLERLEQVAEDTKKVFSYNKHDGTWSWYDRDEAFNMDAGHHGFATRFLALLDAIEPYLIDGDA